MYTLCNAMYATYISFKEEANEEGEYKTSFQDYEDVEGYRSQGVGLQNVKMSKCLILFLSTIFIVQHMIWS